MGNALPFRKKKLAIIGASYLQLPLVLKAREMGIETFCFAWSEGAVCELYADHFLPISILEKELILDICRDNRVDGITSIASDISVPTVCYVANHLDLVGNDYADSYGMTNKFSMRNCFLTHSIPSPEFFLSDDIPDISKINYPLVVKPTDRSGSRGVTLVCSPEDLGSIIDNAKRESFTQQAIIEEYIPGYEVSVESISWQGEHFILTITDKVTTGPPHFVELEHHQPSQLDSQVQSLIRIETIKALNALNIVNGAAHSEFKITPEGRIYIIEVGARMGGDFIGSHLVQLSTGYDFLEGVIKIALGQFDSPIVLPKAYSGVYFLCKERTELRQYVENAIIYPEIVEAKITDSRELPLLSSSDRGGYFIYCYKRDKNNPRAINLRLLDMKNRFTIV